MNPPVLLVEDNEDDIFFMLRCVKTAKLQWNIQCVKDGQAAIDYLSGAGVYADRALYPAPALVLLDLKLPQKDGLEVLEWIRSAGDKSTVVIMFTTSAEVVDVNEAYRLGANAYLVKPSAPELVPALSAINEFWFRLNKFPESAAG